MSKLTEALDVIESLPVTPQKQQSELNALFAGKTFDVAYVSGVEGPSLYIDDYRVCGPKPWGGGKVLKRWKARGEDIATALKLGE